MIVYTAITNKYDKLRDIKLPNGWQAICFTTDTALLSDTWEMCYVENLPLIHRHIKCCPHEYFDFDRCIWIDANLEFKGDWLELDRAGFWAMKHPDRQYLWQEINACIQLNKETNWIKKLNDKYGERGVVATGVLIRDNTPLNKMFGQMWWNQISNYSHRDQLSFCYVADKVGLKYELMPFLKDFIKYKHEVGYNK